MDHFGQETMDAHMDSGRALLLRIVSMPIPPIRRVAQSPSGTGTGTGTGTKETLHKGWPWAR